jgi:hypothetical protein
MEVLQTSALPLGYGAGTRKLARDKEFRKAQGSVVSGQWSVVRTSGHREPLITDH